MTGMLVDENRNTVVKEEDNKSPKKSTENINNVPKTVSKIRNATNEHQMEFKKEPSEPQALVTKLEPRLVPVLNVSAPVAIDLSKCGNSP